MHLPYYIAAHLHFEWMLAVVRSCRNVPLLKHAITLWDPNSIRKNTKVALTPKFARLDFGAYVLLIDLSDHIGFRTYIRNEPFEMSVYRIGKRLNISQGDIVLDIGANIGTASVPLCAETGCELIAIEASKYNASLLARNIYENRITAKLVTAALVSPQQCSRYIPLYLRDGNTGANSIHREWNPSMADAGAENVPTETLDHVMTNEPVDRIKLVKIDVEGAEGDVLAGGKEFLRACKAPILMEYRVDVTRKFLGRDMADVLAILEGTHHVRALDNRGALQAFDKDTPYENIVFLPNERAAELADRLR